MPYPVAARFCSVCGHPLPEGARTCPSCGSRVLLTAVPVDSPLLAGDAKAAAVPDPQMRRKMNVFVILAVAVGSLVVYVTASTGDFEALLVGVLVIAMMYGLIRLPKPGPNPQMRPPR